MSRPITSGYIWLQRVKYGYPRLHMVAVGYNMVTPGVKYGYTWLQWVTYGYTRIQVVTGVHYISRSSKLITLQTCR